MFTEGRGSGWIVSTLSVAVDSLATEEPVESVDTPPGFLSSHIPSLQTQSPLHQMWAL